MRRLLIILLSLLATTAGAGPWPRETGQIYVYTGHQGADDGWSGLYVEYGLERDLTFGLDLGGHIVGLPELYYTGLSEHPVDGRARAFIRAPIPIPDAAPAWVEPWLASVEAGVGRDYLDNGGQINRLGIGASIGRGFGSRIGDGWFTLDMRMAFAAEAETRSNLGAVAGIKPHSRVAIEFGAFVEHEETSDWQAGPTLQVSAGRAGDLRLGVVHLSGEERVEIVAGWSLTF
ncbi:hypothetical protein JSE7799_00215 [Jannaschia seosinensis]|uniref:Uncharacterized protein n=1 Tax=Jannaschia seosinensis TaxID=313367 RepID=A0A0M7B6R9_9RHOB|nr:hypothetical protein [Jannaschia seosinensis]CUH12599.1 hypothetical protein JSE7799_00215 [Jannaschia seosinensis]